MASSARIDELRKKFDENPRRYFAPLANEYRKAGDLDQAIFICQEYLPQQPGHMSGHIVYAQTLFEMGRHDESKAVFETALSLDPENLIALRHLGDIARQTGDAHAARIWYQRVLEADPRNEEIAQIMVSLLADPAAGSRPSTSTPKSTPVLARTVTPPSPAPSQPTAWDQPPQGNGLDVEKSVDKTQLEANTPPATVAQSPAAAPKDEQQGGHEWLDLKDLTIGGVPMGTGTDEESARPDDSNAGREQERPAEVLPGSFTDAFAASMAEPFDESFDEPDAPIESFTETPAESLTGSSARAPEDDEGGFDLGHEDGPFEADPFAIAATPDKSRDSRYAASAPDTTHTVDIGDTPEAAAAISDNAMPDNALPEEGVDEQGVPDETPAVVDGLEQFEAGYMPSAAAAPPAPHIETASFFDAPPNALATPIFSKTLVDSAAIESPARDSSGEEPPGDEPPGMDSRAIDAAETESSATEWSAEELAADVTASEVPIDEVSTDEVRPVESTVAESAFAESTSAGPTQDEQPVNAADATAPVEEAFVTETMAELYLRQGHLESALDIYRKLVEQRPNDDELRARLRAVETQMSPEPTSEPEDEPAAANAYAGPTIREFLMGLTSWRGSEQLGEYGSSQATDADAMGEPPDYADALADVPPEEYSPTPMYRRATPHMGKSVSGSIDALFSGADATAADASAATTLAKAFAPAAGTPLQGVPAHRAANELSLDHVFKANTPARSDAETDGFSFDQFFADDMSDPAPNAAGDAGAPSPEATDDIAQFNAWLNGLKKT